MSTDFGGPIRQAVIGPSEGDRFLFSGAPVEFDPSIAVFKDHFFDFNSVATTGRWSVVKDTGATVALVDGHGGVLALTSTATTDNDGASINTAKNMITLSSSNKVWFEASVKWATVAELDSLVGFCSKPSSFTNPEDVLAENNILAFVVADGSASLKVQSRVEGTGAVTAPTTSVTLTDDTYVRLGIYWNGTTAYMFKDRVVIHTFTSVPSVDMQLSLFSLSGQATGTQKMTVDYVYLATAV